MSKARDRTPSRQSKEADSLAAAVEALKEATDTLARVTAGSPHPTSEDSGTADPPQDNDRERYYSHLEQRGVLVDIDDEVDPASLPPTVTHVRYPDGRVERIAYS